MADFEDNRSKLNILLYVLPPVTPKYNGAAERANIIWREDFCGNPRLSANFIGSMGIEPQKMLTNTTNIGLTPAEYI